MQKMNFSFAHLDFGTNFREGVRNAFPKIFDSSKIDVRKQIRSEEVVKFSLDHEDFIPEEIFRAYPTVSASECRVLHRSVNIRVTAMEASYAATGDNAEVLKSLKENAKSISERLWDDLVEFKVREVDGTNIIADMAFHIPKSMNQTGWLLVHRENAEVISIFG